MLEPPAPSEASEARPAPASFARMAVAAATQADQHTPQLLASGFEVKEGKLLLGG